MIRNREDGLRASVAIARLVACVLALDLLAGCGDGGDGAGQTAVVRDSVGIEIVQSAAPRWTAPGVGWTLDPDPAIEIAGNGADSAYYLYSVTAVRMTAARSIVVANSGTSQLLWFDSAGAFSHAVGRKGGGPGEFRAIYDLFGCAGDTLVVHEGRRLSVLDRDGNFARVIRAGGELYNTMGTVIGVSGDCTAALVVAMSADPPKPRVPDPSDTAFSLFGRVRDRHPRYAPRVRGPRCLRLALPRSTPRHAIAVR